MNGNSNTGAWIVGGLIILALIGFGVWWWGSDRNIADTQNQNQQATTTQPNTSQNNTTPIAREDRTNSDVASVVAGIPEASSFAALFASSGVAASLSSTGTYTVFVPSNSAYNLVAPGTLSGMTTAQKKRLIEYHVVSGRAVDTTAVETGNITAVSKDTLNFEVRDSDNSAMVNSSYILKQYKAKNGIVYLITGVLIPPERAAQ